uniref:FAD-binding PCMH-type domain-containing protein n=1 Tax=Kwoniella dejecticola CBS 10117 TaxID=1296121 RepID=A0A1A6AG42_9TREE|nr:uncharacterized protein I303_00851 [Kwoniella dejecticola CBS 10117]OBR89029.1 hypothetical protein I303_00851 [Kwoniella dejecticola CBS 10117]
MLTDLPDFALLQSEFQGDLVLPSDEGYEKSLKRWASTAQKKAGLVAFVKVEEDIIAILRFVRKNSLDLAVKCGGHSVSGASSSEGGVVIDLSRYFKTVTVDEKARVAHVGGGATWRDVDLATFPHGLASVAGTVSHTGVGGLILGGGYGYLAGEHGLVIDNLVGARVISADGEMHNCSEEENQDLFWAIRGGGGNFGIVTSFSLTIHPQIPQVFIADLHFPGEKVEEFSVAVKQWLELSTKKEMLFVFLEDRGTGPVRHVPGPLSLSIE